MIVIESLIVMGAVVTHSVIGYIGFKLGKKFSKKDPE
jgi:hypothetical protein